jgi:hypothetical protein
MSRWLNFGSTCEPRTRGNPLVEISFMIPNAAHAKPQEFRSGTCASPFFERRAAKCEVRGGLVSAEDFRHATVSGKE